MEYGILLYVRKGISPQRFALRAGSVTVGSGQSNDLVLDGDGVSEVHLRVISSPTGIMVTDLGSTNGTFLNQVRLKANAPQPLRDGDTLRVGPYALRYQRGAAPAAAQPPGAAPGVAGEEPARGPSAGGVLPPEVAGRLPPGGPPGPPIRRLRGNGGPPRLPPGARRMPMDVSSYLQYLPPFYDDVEIDPTRFMGRFLLIFESILDPIERTVDNINLMFAPQVAPEAMLPWLATWVDLVLNENWPLARRRALVGAAAELYRWRGTRRGLSDYIRIYTGVEPEIIEPGQPRGRSLPANVFRVIIRAPDPSQIDRALVEAIIEAEKPAHTGYLLDIR